MNQILFIGAHQDDETLLMGGGIINHLSNPQNNVFYSCITDGSASKARGSTEDYIFKAWRDAEKNAALSRMGNVIQLYSTEGVMKDGKLNKALDYSGDSNGNPANAGFDGNDVRYANVNMDIVSRIRDLLTQISSKTGCQIRDIRVKTHSHGDAHPDHRALCQAVLYLYSIGEIVDVRHYTDPRSWSGPVNAYNMTFPSAEQLGAEIEKPANEDAFVNALLEFVSTDNECGGYKG